jgi:hypothetical protein
MSTSNGPTLYARAMALIKDREFKIGPLFIFNKRLSKLKSFITQAKTYIFFNKKALGSKNK